MKIYKNENFKKVRVNNEDTILPNDWFIKKYKDFGGFKTGKDYKNFIGDKYSVYGSSEKAMPIKTNFPLYSNISFIIGRKGTINKPYRIDKPFWCVDTAMYFNLSSGNRDFLFYTCSMVDWMKYNKGGVLPSLTQSFINEFEFISPNVEEQKRIADVLSKQESIINKTKDLIEQLDKRNTFMLDELLSGRLRIKEENGKMEFYKNPDDNWKDVLINRNKVKIPKDYNNIKIEGNYSDLGKSKIKAKSCNLEGKYPFFNCSVNQTLRSDNYIHDLESLYLSTGGKPAVHYYNGKASYSTDVWSISFNKDEILNKFIYLFFYNNMSLLEQSFKGAGLKHLSKKDFQNIEIILPSKIDQENIIEIYKKINNEKEKYEELLIEEQKKFDFLLEELMSGRLRIEE